MKKPALIEVVIVALGAIVAASIAQQLAAHHVGLQVIVPAVAGSISSSTFFAAHVANVARTKVFTCPDKSCDASIRVRDTGPDELDRLRALAADHTRHGATR